jgi:hypothetical protein
LLSGIRLWLIILAWKLGYLRNSVKGRGIASGKPVPYEPDKIKKVTCPKCEEKRKAELCKSEDIRDRIAGGYYGNNDDKYAQFVDDAIDYVGLTNHPKRNKIFGFAWEHGHADGYESGLCWLEELADLV